MREKEDVPNGSEVSGGAPNLEVEHRKSRVLWIVKLQMSYEAPKWSCQLGSKRHESESHLRGISSLMVFKA